MQTTNIVDENIRRIGELFPNCLTERLNEEGKPVVAIDFDQLRQELSQDIVEGPEERYQFTWPDKRNAIRLANAPTTDTLRPRREESVDFDTTQNLYIEGDNLQVLKLLRENYLGKVKMIYIDPPYNTGNDFVYNDDFAQSTTEYVLNSGQKDEYRNLLVANTESNGRFHTDWLNMIYPRLKVAKDLLSEDGVIFISIDDNEVENLKKVCDEIFGEGNFLCVFPRVTKKGGKSSAEIAKNHDYVLAYTKNRINADLIGIAHDDEGYSNKDEYFETRGYYKANQTLDYDSLGYVASLDYPIVIDGEVFYAGGDKEQYDNRHKGLHGRADWGWRWSEELYAFGKENGFIEVHRGGGRPRIYTKTYQKVKIEKVNSKYEIIPFDRTKPLSTLEFADNKYSNDNAKRVLDELLKSSVFEYTKPPVLVSTCAKLVNSKDYIVLDFFSGSATTAHAVMQLNAEDGGNRKFIMVQLPEAVDEKSEAFKAGYKTICEIGKERIRRAGQKIKDDNPLTTQRLDTGFRVLKLDSSNMEDVYYTPAEFNELKLFEDNVKPDRTEEDLLFQTMTELGVELSAKIEKMSIGGKNVWSVSDGYLMACFDAEVNETTITEVARRKPFYFVMRDSSLANDQVADNFEQIWQEYSDETVRRII